MKAKVIEAHYHLPASSGQLTLPQLKRHFKTNDGFTIQFAGTDHTLPFTWKEMIEFAGDVKFFGAPVEGVRNYSRLFKSVFTEKYAQQIYYEIAKETAGDSFASMALAHAFKDCIIGIQTARIDK